MEEHNMPTLFGSPFKTNSSSSNNEDNASIHSEENGAGPRHLFHGSHPLLVDGGNDTLISEPSLEDLTYGNSRPGSSASLPNNDNLHSWATELRSNLHQLILNHNLVVDSPDVMSLTNSIVGALECLQRQQDSLAESHEEQMNMFNQLSREKNSREILELRTVELEDEMEEIKRKHREENEKNRSEKRKLDLEVMNLKDSVSRLEVQKKDLEKEGDNLRDKYSKSMGRYLEDVRRLKAMQNAERDSNAEKDLNVMNQIRENVASAKKGPYDSGEIFFESQDEDEDGGKIISERGTVGVGRFDSICSTSSEVHVMHENAVAEETTTCSEESQSEAATPNQRASPTPVEISTQHFADSRHTSSSKTSVAVSTRASIQSFETNYETLDQEFANMQQQPFNSLYASTNDVLAEGAENQLFAPQSVIIGLIDDYQEDAFSVYSNDDSFGGGRAGIVDSATWNSTSRTPKAHLGVSSNSSNNSHPALQLTVIDNLTGMNEEVQQLLEENTRLQETKNALNVVKDDLIAKVDQMTHEQEFLKEEFDSLNQSRDELQQRVQQLDAEVKRLHTDLEKAATEASKKSENSTSLADELSTSIGAASNQSEKKFTKREVSTLLMERNMYKERYLELQETVRWMGMMQAERPKHPELMTGGAAGSNKSSFGGSATGAGSGSIWKLFSGLFGASGQPNASSGSKRSAAHGTSPSTILNFDGSAPNEFTAVKRPDRNTNVPEDQLPQRGNEKWRRKSSAISKARNEVAGSGGRSQIQSSSSKVTPIEGHEETCGWSVNSNAVPEQPLGVRKGSKNSMRSNRSATLMGTPNGSDASSVSAKSLPIPIYSKPLMEKDPSFKNLSLQCACSAILTGGQYVLKSDKNGATTPSSPVEQSFAGHRSGSFTSSDECLTSANVGNCAMVWVCSSSATCSRVSVFDLTSPAESLTSITFPNSQILTIRAVPGCMQGYSDIDSVVASTKRVPESDGVCREDDCSSSSVSGTTIHDFGKISDCISASVSCHASSIATSSAPISSQGSLKSNSNSLPQTEATTSGSNADGDSSSIEREKSNPTGRSETVMVQLNEAQDHLHQIEKDVLSNKTAAASDEFPKSIATSDFLARSRTTSADSRLPPCYWPPNIVNPEDLSCTSKNPTIWIGCENGNLFVHSAIANWNCCLLSVRLPSSIYTIDFINDRVFIGLSSGSIAVFYRDSETLLWDLVNYQLLDLGRPVHCVRCAAVAPGQGGQWNLWAGHRNKIHIINPTELKIIDTITGHVRRESQIRHLAVSGVGVWVSIRMESTLKLFHAISHQHLQDLNPEASIIRILGQACKINFLRVTSLACIGKALWIGTNVGVVISIPVGEESQSGSMFSKSAAGKGSGTAKPGGIVRIFNDDSSASYSVTSNHRTTSLNSSHFEHSTSTTGTEHTTGTTDGVATATINMGTGSSPSSSHKSCSVSLMTSPHYASQLLSAVKNQHVPLCSLSQLRLSFHAHRHDVKFFVAALQSSPEKSATLPPDSTSPSPKSSSLLNPATDCVKHALHIMSGGRGYIDHRVGDKSEDNEQNVPLVVGAAGTISAGNTSTLTSMGTLSASNKSSLSKIQRSYIIQWKQEIG